MDTDEHRVCPDSLTERVIGATLEVSNILGAGFLEKVYERALLHELGLQKPKVEWRRIVLGFEVTGKIAKGP
jgi:GxxExxY protein